MRHVGGKQPLALQTAVEAGDQLIDRLSHRIDLMNLTVTGDGIEILFAAAFEFPLQLIERPGDPFHRLIAKQQRQRNHHQARHCQAGHRFMDFSLHVTVHVALLQLGFHQKLNLLFTLMPQPDHADHLEDQQNQTNGQDQAKAHTAVIETFYHVASRTPSCVTSA